MEQITKYSDPYAPIRKVPLDYKGIKSNAYSIQLEDWCKTGEDIDGKPEYGNKWQEKGVVSSNYLLIPNNEVKEMAEIISKSSGIEWKECKTFFNGKQYMYSMTSDTIRGQVKEGDDVSLGFAMWNSYDGSRALSFEMFLNRLVCNNGMITKKNFETYKFSHNPSSHGWQDELENVCNLIENVPIDNYIESFSRMTRKLSLNSHDLTDVRNALPNVPTGTWGKILDKFLLDKEYNNYSAWDLLNASTHLLWHNKKQTMADFNMNGYIVEGMCDWINSVN